MGKTEWDQFIRDLLHRHYGDYAYYRDMEWSNSPAPLIKAAIHAIQYTVDGLPLDGTREAVLARAIEKIRHAAEQFRRHEKDDDGWGVCVFRSVIEDLEQHKAIASGQTRHP